MFDPAAAATSSARQLIPADASLDALREAAAGCQACDLWRTGTQTVFGEGGSDVDIMLVGEQPGDREDLAGSPFVGPAGKLLDDALEEAGIDRRRAYVTNVFKHFKWLPRGKRRIHQRPDPREIGACRPWLEAEIAQVRPKIIVCLGATAAQALIDRNFRVTRQRGEVMESPLGPLITATVHPSSILRAASADMRSTEMQMFVDDLRHVSERVAETSRPGG